VFGGYPALMTREYAPLFAVGLNGSVKLLAIGDFRIAAAQAARKWHKDNGAFPISAWKCY
jgi:hypothetical protein